MKTKILSCMGIFAMLLGLFAGVSPVKAAPKLPDYRPVDVGPEIRGWEATAERIDPSITPKMLETDTGISGVTMSSCFATPTLKTFMILNDFHGVYQFANFELYAESNNTQIWVQKNLSWPAGDLRPTPIITCEQAQYMLGEFDNNIYPKEVAFFGEPNFHDGAYSLLEDWGYFDPGYYYDEAGRQIVLVSNVRDKNFYVPNYGIYIAGFYSPSFEAYFDRNVMTIDAYDWANRTGPGVTRPYLYEGIFAHEYQHLLHDDYDPDEENFVNEGLAEMATILTGYPNDLDKWTWDYPENSLVVWGDQGDDEILADYGQAYLFQYYLMEQCGLEMLKIEFINPNNGITGINTTFDFLNIQKDFGEVYHDWSVAALIDATKAGDRYGFVGLDFMMNIGTPQVPNLEAFDTLGAPPWGTDYIWLTGNPKELAKLEFNGIDYLSFPSAWTSIDIDETPEGEDYVLWSGDGDLIDNWAIFETTGGGMLTFDTYYDIEELWDFGFVQVSTDGGFTWTSLANAYTTSDYDPSAHPKVIENLPGLTGSQTLVTMSFDLSAYAGQNILVAFRYITDWATTGAGWFIDNVYVDGTLISDGSDASIFKDITEIIPLDTDFNVTLVGMTLKKKQWSYQVFNVKLDALTEESYYELNRVMRESSKVAMLVTYDAPEGVTVYAPYTYDFSYAKPK